MPLKTIAWMTTDEAPALAAYSLVPIVKAFTRGTGIEIETWDLSLAARILGSFPDFLSEEQQIPNYLAHLGEVAKTPAANIIKPPAVSASIPQLKAAIQELQDVNYPIPDFPENPKTEKERALRARFSKIFGSVVNETLREGNCDRRVPRSVKHFAQKSPHTRIKPWPKSGSKTRVAHLHGQDFFGTEKSTEMDAAKQVQIVFVSGDGNGGAENRLELKRGVELERGEVIDTAVMSVAALQAFFRQQIALAKQEDLLVSLHLKATQMKVVDPIILGHCIRVFYADIFTKHADALADIDINPNHGMADLFEKLERLSPEKKVEIEAEIRAIHAGGPGLAMVDAEKGITNLDLPNHVIIDASMANLVRDGGRMLNHKGHLVDTLAMIPDRSYARVYQVVIEDCQKHGQFDPATMGTVANVGLMAQKAQEYGVQDATFEAPGDGKVLVVDAEGEILLEQVVKTGDIFRMCQTKEAAIQNWVKLAVARATSSGLPTIFWLDNLRGHDRQLIAKVKSLLKQYDLTGLDIRIMAPTDAMTFTLERIRRGADTIAVTGNVLRDYLTYLFPVLELGTSARMISNVPLLNGGGIFETGAAGSAPKHVKQFLEEGHLRWDSLGDYVALVSSLRWTQTPQGFVLAKTLEDAIERYLRKGKSPSRKVHELDNRGSTFYLAMYWAEALAKQREDLDLAKRFAVLASALGEHEGTIQKELAAAQGDKVDLGGYFVRDPVLAEQVMRPSATLNGLIENL